MLTFSTLHKNWLPSLIFSSCGKDKSEGAGCGSCFFLSLLDGEVDILRCTLRTRIKLVPGAGVWIWVLRLGKGKWWPGVVEQVTVLTDQPTFRVRFECSSAKGSRTHIFVGISTTLARYLELRDPEVKEADRPRFVPRSLFQKPAGSERTASVGGTHGDPGRAND